MDTAMTPAARLALLPPIRRARLWRLYAEGTAEGRQRRFLDLWMDGGRSILGAKGTGLGTAAKAAIDMGLARPLPSVWTRRLEKALLETYPGFASARLFPNRDRALAALGAAFPGAEPALLRPFGEHLRGNAPADSRFALPLLPCPALLEPGVVLAREGADAEALAAEQVPPAALAAAARALREFAAFSRVFGEGLWRKADRRLAPYFERSGPYLYPRCPETEYDTLFRAALGAGLLLSPEYAFPSILPGDFDDGELAALGKAISANA